MNTKPTFQLPPCPICSSLFHLARPFWRFAHNTSRAKGADHYAFTGCKHADEVGNAQKLRSDPAEWALVEEAWGIEAVRLFAGLTENWPAPAVDRLRRALEDKAFLPGAVEPLPLSPATPEQPEPHEQK